MTIAVVILAIIGAFMGGIWFGAHETDRLWVEAFEKAELQHKDGEK